MESDRIPVSGPKDRVSGCARKVGSHRSRPVPQSSKPIPWPTEVFRKARVGVETGGVGNDAVGVGLVTATGFLHHGRSPNFEIVSWPEIVGLLKDRLPVFVCG